MMINDFRGKYRFLSNFWSVFIEWEGDTYPSTENAFQAMKCKNQEDRKLFFTCKASEAKQIGRIVPIREDWDEIRVDVMYQIVKQKFSFEPLRSMLLETSGMHLEEGNWWGDTFWGTVNGKGENHLGKILMRVREELSE